MTASGTNDYGSWTVGEAHTEQNVTMVLMGKNHYTLVTPVLNKDGSVRTTCSFVVGQKNCVGYYDSAAEQGYMNNTDYNTGSWNSCYRRAWCNAAYRAAIPSTLRPIFKQFQVKTASEYNASTITTSNDWFALFAAKEVTGITSASVEIEANNLTQVEHYITTSNRIKKRSDLGWTDITWWLRSPSRVNTETFCSISSGGEWTYDSANMAFGIAPFGVI